jgi:hypothetical protein
MAARKPLVLVSGVMQQLQAGDTLDAVVTEKELVSMTNKNAGTINIGAPTYVKSTATQIDLAKADAAGTARVLGLVADETIAADASGNIQTNGVMTLTTAQWDAVAGTTGGLAAGTIYYLSAATAGLLTATCPTTGYVVPVGCGLSTVAMLIEPEPPIKL